MRSTWVGAAAIGILVLAACEDDETTNPTTASSTRAASTTASTVASTTASTGAGGIGGGATGGAGGDGGIGGMGMGGTGTGGAMASQLVINEVNASVDWVEFYNVGTAAIDISGWKFSDNQPTDNTHVYTFPANTVVPAGSYIVRVRNDVNTQPDEFAFGLGDTDSILLFDATQDPATATPVESTTWPAGDADTSWGRLPNGTGMFQALTAPTQGTANM